MELREGPRDADRSEGGVDVSKPCLLRIGLVVDKADQASEKEGVFVLAEVGRAVAEFRC